MTWAPAKTDEISISIHNYNYSLSSLITAGHQVSVPPPSSQVSVWQCLGMDHCSALGWACNEGWTKVCEDFTIYSTLQHMSRLRSQGCPAALTWETPGCHWMSTSTRCSAGQRCRETVFSTLGPEIKIISTLLILIYIVEKGFAVQCL